MTRFNDIYEIEAAAKGDRYGDYVYAMQDHGSLAVRHIWDEVDAADVFVYQYAPPKTVSYFRCTVQEAEEFFDGHAPVKG